MILIDAVFINNGGGLVLLKNLVDELEKSELDIFYLFDDRTTITFNCIDIEKRTFISNSVFKRNSFYLRNKEEFSSVLCFGNLPPPIKLQIPVFTYFHQPLFLKIPYSFSVVDKFKYILKQKFLSFSKKNTDLWLVQSNLISREFSKKYLNGNEKKIKTLPFYPPINISKDDNIKRVKNSFIYVSNGVPHKNHKRLINAFCEVYDNIQCGSLMVTVPSSSIELCKLISDKISLGYPITNVGFIDREQLIELYLSHEYLIFPSLAESFGLGLAEAIDCGCKVLVSDLPYAYEVCKPSLTFDPYSIKSIKEAILLAIENNLPDSEKLISNNINKLISILAE